MADCVTGGREQGVYSTRLSDHHHYPLHDDNDDVVQGESLGMRR